MISRRELRLMRKDAFLVNTSRGSVIDEEAMIEALRSKKIGGAGLDVFETEPLPNENELWALENVIITPHVSGINIPEEICEEFIRNYERWIRGEPLMGLVDRKKGY